MQLIQLIMNLKQRFPITLDNLAGKLFNLNLNLKLFKKCRLFLQILILAHNLSILITDHRLCRTPSGIYLLKVNNRNTRTRCEICSRLTTPERRWRLCGVFIVNFEHISHLVLMFLLLTYRR